MSIFNQIGQIWNQYREFRATFNELSNMSDAELRDMGLFAATSSASPTARPKPTALRSPARAGTSVKSAQTSPQGGFGMLHGSH